MVLSTIFRFLYFLSGRRGLSPVCVYCRPEDLWGYEVVTGSYREKPLLSKEKIYGRLKELYPDADGKAADRLLNNG